MKSTGKPSGVDAAPLILYGFGVKVSVNRGMLDLSWGDGSDRHTSVLSRGECPKRIVIVGSAGYLTLEAIEWCSEAGVSFCVLDRRGNLLAEGGGLNPENGALHRRQALARENGLGLQLARDMLGDKLAAQSALLRSLGAETAAAQVENAHRCMMESAETIDECFGLEGGMAGVYWGVLSRLPVMFAPQFHDVPDHWQTFGNRKSVLSEQKTKNTPAASPGHAMVNFLYGVLASEARIACRAHGLDPTIGVVHADRWSSWRTSFAARDGLIYDVVEPVRAIADQVVIDVAGGVHGPLGAYFSGRLKAASGDVVPGFLEMRDASVRLTPGLVRLLTRLSVPIIRPAVSLVVAAVRRQLVEWKAAR